MKAFLYRACAIIFSHFVLYPDYRISFFIPLAFRFADYTYEEFYIPGEKINLERFISLGVIEEVKKRPIEEIDSFLNEMESIFAEPDFTKEEVITAIKRFIPNFEHDEKGKNLDEKM